VPTAKLIAARRSALQRKLQAASRKQLEDIAQQLTLALYGPALDPDEAVSGADFVDAMGALLVQAGVYAVVMEVGRERS
jgi:hypothetical protein